MKIPIIDASLYFKGLLLLIRKDHNITNLEIKLMKHIGNKLGFEKEFCNRAIHEIMDNKFIADVPPEFSTPDLAAKFIRDGLTMALIDNTVHPKEEEWLMATAQKNGFDSQWFFQEKQRIEEINELPDRLEVDELIIDYELSGIQTKINLQ